MSAPATGWTNAVATWGRCLDLAGVHDPGLRTAYTTAARYTRRRETAMWAMTRALAPARYQPHLVVGAAMGFFTDDVCDRAQTRELASQQLAAWTERIRHAVETGSSKHPILRTYLNSCQDCGLSPKWALIQAEGTHLDIDFAGFATEAEYQAYVDALSWPGLIVIMGLFPHVVADDDFAHGLRALGDAVQRIDILHDLHADLRQGRMRLVQNDLDRYGVTCQELERGIDTPDVRALVAATAAAARTSLNEASCVLDQVDPEFATLTRIMLSLLRLRLDRIDRLGAALTRAPARDNLVACLRLLATSRTRVPA